MYDYFATIKRPRLAVDNELFIVLKPTSIISETKDLAAFESMWLQSEMVGCTKYSQQFNNVHRL
mgnify:CR=1 FL=1